MVKLQQDQIKKCCNIESRNRLFFVVAKFDVDIFSSINDIGLLKDNSARKKSCLNKIKSMFMDQLYRACLLTREQLSFFLVLIDAKDKLYQVSQPMFNSSYCSTIKLMWVPLYGIKVYGIIQLMGSIEPDLPVPNYYIIPNVCIQFIQLLLSFG